MEKLKMESVSIAEDSLNKIAELFPNVVTESMGKDGQLHKAIDFDKLKFLLTANQAEMGVVYDDDERYELTWVGKKQAIREAAHPIRKTLRPCPEESRNWEQTQNLYIEGDNLDAMKLLKKSYAGKVDVIGKTVGSQFICLLHHLLCLFPFFNVPTYKRYLFHLTR